MAWLPHDTRVIEALDRADAARVRLADAIAASDEATQRAAEHATEAIVALIPRFTDSAYLDRMDHDQGTGG